MNYDIYNVQTNGSVAKVGKWVTTEAGGELKMDVARVTWPGGGRVKPEHKGGQRFQRNATVLVLVPYTGYGDGAGDQIQKAVEWAVSNAQEEPLSLKAPPVFFRFRNSGC